MLRFWRQKLRGLVVTTLMLLVIPVAWGGNTCRDRINKQTCRYQYTRNMSCCQHVDNRWRYVPCVCEVWRDSEYRQYYYGGPVDFTGETNCEPFDYTCC